VLVALLLGLAPAAAAAQSEADVKDAGGIVMQQLEAFRRDDFETAFGFASTEIHQLFDRARFEQMVRTGYPEIARSASAVIEGVERADGSRLYLFVRVRGANGRVVEAIYELLREAGGWRINGVVTRPDATEKT
jgi:phosphoglycolate phosphatase-like HAD superfamily hydrolase